MEISMLKSVIQQATNCHSSEVVPEARLIVDLKMDASGAIVCSQQIKGVLQVQVEAGEILRAETVGQLLKLINSRRKQAGVTMTIDRNAVLPKPINNTKTEKEHGLGGKVMWELEMFVGLLLIIFAILLSMAHNIPGLKDINAFVNRTNNVINILIPVIAAIGGLMIGWGWKKLNEKKR